MIDFSHQRSVWESLQEYGRGIAGGLMFSVPLLFTMEVWWAGFLIHPWRMLLYVLVTYGLLLLYNRFAGLRRDASWWEVAIDSVEEIGIGLVLSALILWLTGRISGESQWLENLGKIVMEGMTIAIGVSVGTAHLGGSEGEDSGKSEAPESGSKYLAQVAVAFCGAVLFAATMAPTEEVVMLAIEIPPLRLLTIALMTLLLVWLILHFSDFRGAKKHVDAESLALRTRGIVTTYAVALFASAGSLWFFGQFDGETMGVCLSSVVILGFPAALGASAGRLLLQVS
ncbi:MAG: TIGR02587 family membrane protein [Armatimonadetes bacterium]|nr:TIGR02587 family membrane protein [Akkermansiaceae bacterium]